MNLVFLSPHFPDNHHQYCRRLREQGVRVFGIGDAPWDTLLPRVRESLTDYFQVHTLEDYDAVYRAFAYFVHQHGRIDQVESHTEHWMRTEARLREDYRVLGRTTIDLETIQRKSAMKDRFVEAKIPAARGRLFRTIEEARSFVDEVGFPLVAKPDIGVGAAATYRIDSLDDLARVEREKGDRDYFLEEFVTGAIVTFDGLAGPDGRVVFSGSLEYSQGVMEAVNHDLDLYYFTHREIPESLAELGRRAISAFEVRGGFFHFEFFRRPDGSYLVLEANIRPPGAWSVDMFNWGADLDLYAEWARIVARREPLAQFERKYFCCYAGRKNNLSYRRSHDEVMERFGPRLVHHQAIPAVFRNAIGDYGYLFRTPDRAEMESIAAHIQEKA